MFAFCRNVYLTVVVCFLFYNLVSFFVVVMRNILNHQAKPEVTSTFIYSQSVNNGVVNDTTLPTRNFLLAASGSASGRGLNIQTPTEHTPSLKDHIPTSSTSVSVNKTSSGAVESECLEHYEHNLEKYKG